ncbi:MAG: hypothetical protein CUN56_01975 [Phototrophicales bacterium]|nr:MAG: hypothetical protein CUN56_01975 [Phototrophicales bacterium]RMG74388.1 MAG: hypothetical protein D6711_08985 [Chloroflexota bacterium]
MRRILRKIIQILDGTPQTYGKKQRGQSVVELALVTPLLIILLVGLVEIGWFARNYLTLLEVSRVGARRGAVLSGENSPLLWNEWASLYSIPGNEASYDPYWNTYPVFETDPGWDPVNQPTQSKILELRVKVRNCNLLNDPNTYVGFYNLVLCQMLNSLDPLSIVRDPAVADSSFGAGLGDIIISVFAVQMVRTGPGSDVDINLNAAPTIYANEFKDADGNDKDTWVPVVVGRYPTRANECNVWRRVDSGQVLLPPAVPPYERDPFDYYYQNDSPLNHPGRPDGDVDLMLVNDPDLSDGDQGPLAYPIELANLINGQFVSPGFDPYDFAEVQRGFVYTGLHQVELTAELDDGSGGTFEAELVCFGSDKTVYWVQDMLQAEGFIMSDSEIAAARAIDPNFGYEMIDTNGDGTPDTQVEVDQRQYLVNQGVILVEIYWEHQLLLRDFPVFSPILNMVNDGKAEIYVWSAFPAPTVVPEIRYNLTWNDLTDED